MSTRTRLRLTGLVGLITRRSQVQILPPPPSELHSATPRGSRPGKFLSRNENGPPRRCGGPVFVSRELVVVDDGAEAGWVGDARGGGVRELYLERLVRLVDVITLDPNDHVAARGAGRDGE